jgi:hypothetical protein
MFSLPCSPASESKSSAGRGSSSRQGGVKRDKITNLLLEVLIWYTSYVLEPDCLISSSILSPARTRWQSAAWNRPYCRMEAWEPVSTRGRGPLAPMPGFREGQPTFHLSKHSDPGDVCPIPNHAPGRLGCIGIIRTGSWLVTQGLVRYMDARQKTCYTSRNFSRALPEATETNKGVSDSGERGANMGGATQILDLCALQNAGV